MSLMKIKLTALASIFLAPTAFATSTNNLNYDYAKGASHASVFSTIVYDDWNKPSIPLPAGWSYFVQLPPNLQSSGYYGESFCACGLVANQTKQRECTIVVAHRGTTPSIWDVYADFEVAMGKVPYDYYNRALEYTKLVYQQAELAFGNVDYLNYEQTGHSLGAVLAELVTSQGLTPKTNHINPTPATAYAFDSPGSKPIVIKMIAEGIAPKNALEIDSNTVRQYLSGSNFINTWNEQLTPFSRKAYQFAHEDFSKIPTSTIGPPGMQYYFLHYSINQHGILNFYALLNSTNKIQLDPNKSWPVGMNEGYTAYSSSCWNLSYWAEYQDYLYLHGSFQKYNPEDFYKSFFATLVNQCYFPHAELKHQEPDHNALSELDAEILNVTKQTLPITSKERPTLYDVINNDYDGHADLRRDAYENATSDQKLYYAVMCGDVAFAKKLMQRSNLDLTARHGRDRYSLLQIAVIYGYKDMVEFLLNANVNPNLQDIHSNTALHTVAHERYGDAAEYAKILINAGTKANIKNNAGETPLMIMQKHCPECAQKFAAASQ